MADNIRWGKPDATDEEITRAAVAADAHALITRLADGYDTRIGQRGRLLSGGQRQRLAIARAVIRDSPVLLLDEPTTGLDAESTQRVIAPLRRLMAGRAATPGAEGPGGPGRTRFPPCRPAHTGSAAGSPPGAAAGAPDDGAAGRPARAAASAAGPGWRATGSASVSGSPPRS